MPVTPKEIRYALRQNQPTDTYVDTLVYEIDKALSSLTTFSGTYRHAIPWETHPTTIARVCNLYAEHGWKVEDAFNQDTHTRHLILRE